MPQRRQKSSGAHCCCLIRVFLDHHFSSSTALSQSPDIALAERSVPGILNTMVLERLKAGNPSPHANARLEAYGAWVKHLAIDLVFSNQLGEKKSTRKGCAWAFGDLWTSLITRLVPLLFSFESLLKRQISSAKRSFSILLANVEAPWHLTGQEVEPYWWAVCFAVYAPAIQPRTSRMSVNQLFKLWIASVV